jgi:CRP-like cAMP-binding protein
MRTARTPCGHGHAVTFESVDDAALASIPLFAELTDDERRRLAAVCTEVAVEAGTELVREADFGYVMFGIATGNAEVSRNGVVLRQLGAGDVFGEIAVLSGGRRTASVTATTPMELVAIMNRDVWRLEREAPELGASLRQTIADCLAAA